MIRSMRIGIGIAVMLVAGVASAHTANTQARQQDLNFISTQLPKLHPDFFFQLSPADFESAVSSLQSQLSTLTDAQFYVGLAQLVALAGDAHTTLYLDDAAAARDSRVFRWPSPGWMTGSS